MSIELISVLVAVGVALAVFEASFANGEQVSTLTAKLTTCHWAADSTH